MSTPTPSSRTNSTAGPSLLFVSTTSPLPPSGDLSEEDCQRIFAQFVARIEEADDENLSADIGLEGVEPTAPLISWAESTMAALEDIKRRREARIQTLYDQLEGLWRRLGVADEDMDGFVEAHRGSTEDVAREYEEELERMLELKRERMGVFIENARGEIERLWDVLMVGEEERLDFAPFADGKFDCFSQEFNSGLYFR
jgi:Ase1/PRC1/MAP65 family protein